MNLLHTIRLAVATLAFGLVGCAQMPAPTTPPGPAAAGKVGVLWLGQSAFKITTPTGKGEWVNRTRSRLRPASPASPATQSNPQQIGFL